MSFQHCDIVFHTQRGALLYSGQEVTGAFQFRQTEPKQIQGMSYKVTGQSKTQWSEFHGTGKNRQTINYYGCEGHVNIGPVTLLGGYPRQHGNVTIDAGLSTFKFSFTLPQGIPSSFEGMHGSTSYEIILTAERANKFDKTKEFPFTVACFNDLNLNLMNSMPVKQVVSKHFSTFFIDQGSLEMTVELPMAGYVSGQNLPIKCLAQNKSSIFVSCIIFGLERIVTYASNQTHHAGIKTEKDKIAEFIGQHVEKESDSVLKVDLTIPYTPPSSMSNSLITLQYFLKVKAVVSGMHTNLKSRVPITIGTVPVSAQYNVVRSASTDFKQKNLGIPPTANYPSCPNLSQFPPLPNFQPSALRNPQFSPLQNSQLPQFRSQQLLPTPSAPPMYSDAEQTRESGLPTYEESQKM